LSALSLLIALSALAVGGDSHRCPRIPTNPEGDPTMATSTAAKRTPTAVEIWKEAVDRARTALARTLEGRMEAAVASFEVIPPNGKGAKGRTLVDFAEQVGLSLAQLEQYRELWRWIGDSRYVSGIGSYSVAVLAMKSGRWKTGADWAAYYGDEVAPGSPPWTVDKLRKVLERAQTNTGKRAKRNGRPDSKEPAQRADGPAAEAARKVQGILAKAFSTDYPGERGAFLDKAIQLIRDHKLEIRVLAP
jgi:hypothetical protein